MSAAIFLSYAREDAAAARRIAEALRAGGLEVWFDETELGGGDAWDQKIRKQIKDCALFVPVISANTQARREGYFRREWRLAVERMHDMDDHLPFLVPVVIDDTQDAAAFVPDRFRERQWVRLKDGATPSAFCDRVRKLLAGDVDGAKANRPKTEDTSRSQTENRTSQRWLIPSVAGAVVVMAIALALFKSGAASKLPSPNSNLPSSAKPTTEAQQLVAKARQVWDEGDDMNREMFALAEELLVKAEKLDVSEASAWALHAQLSEILYSFSLEPSAARLDAVRTQADRAVRLAPGSVDTELARASAQFAFGQFGSVLEEQLKNLAAKYPDDPRVYRLLGRSYHRAGKTAEALVAYERALRLLPDNPRLKNDRLVALHLAGRFSEAENATAEAMKGRRDARLLWNDVLIKLVWNSDLAGAFKSIREWPAWFLREDRGVAVATVTALWAHDPDKALEFVQRLPRDYVRDYLFTGPRAVLSAWAHEQAEHTQSARADWNLVLQVAERELTAEPANPVALHWKAWAMAKLGDAAAAMAILQQLEERKVAAPALTHVTGGLAGLALMLGRFDDAIDQISNLRPNSAANTRPITRTMLKLNPVFDPLRQDPRFQALVDRTPGPEDATTSKPQTPNSELSNPRPADSKSVAVLAFDNLSGDRDNEYFSDGISEELLNVLAKVPGLRVAARTSAFYFKDKKAPIADIAKQLNVGYVVEGSIRKVGTQVRIAAKLVNASDGFQLWSDSFTRELKDIFALQDEIAGLIAKNLELTLGAARPTRTVDPEAHRLVLEGRYFVKLRTEDGFGRAEVAFAKAIETDSKYAEAHAGLAEACALRALYLEGTKDVAADRARAETEAQRALALDPTLPDPHAALGLLWSTMGRSQEAETAFQRAFAANPNHPDAYLWHAALNLYSGRLDLALTEYERALRLDPLSVIAHDRLTEELFYSGQDQAAKVESDRTLALRPDGIMSQTRAIRLAILEKLGQREEALAVAKSMRPAPGDSLLQVFYQSYPAWLLERSGRQQEVAAYTAELDARIPSDSFVRGFLKAAEGDLTGALPFLARTPPYKMQHLYWSPIFDPYRNDPRFQQLFEKLGLTAEYKVARETLARIHAQHK